MLSANFPIEDGTKKEEFDPIPEGMYQCEITDIREKEGTKYMSTEKEMKIEFEFKILGNSVAQGRKLWKKITPKYSEPYEGGKPSNLFVILRAALGRVPTIEDSSATALNSLKGKQVNCVVKQEKGKDGKMWNNISDFLGINEEITTADEELGEVEF